MAYGTHWEWRGFGAVTPRFAQSFLELPVHAEAHTVEDDYLWIPGLEVNAKFREGVEHGLKFKRIQKTDGNYEVWTEDPDELFEFPINASAWSMLKEDLEEAGLTFPEYPGSPRDRRELCQLLRETGCEIVTVQKWRESRRWEFEQGQFVLVEWAVVSEPQRCISIGLENGSTEERVDLTTDQSLNMLRNATTSLQLENEPLEPQNYLEVVKQWARGTMI